MLPDRLRALIPQGEQPRALVLLVGVYLTQFALYFFVDGARVADEELHTPTVAALISAGYPMDLARLQYTTFCGGCTAETLLALPLFAVLGPSLAAWRLISLLAGGLILVGAYRFVYRMEGPQAALLTGLLLVLAPPYYRESGIIAFGSHFEVMGLVILALFPWLALLQHNRKRDAFLLGLWLGLAFWFSYSSAFALPVLVGSWLLWRGRSFATRDGLVRLATLACGFLVGIIPLLWTQGALRAAHILVKEAPLTVYGRSLGDLLAGPPSLSEKFMTLVGPSYWASIFHPTIGTENMWPALLYAIAQALVLVLSCWLGWKLWREARSGPQRAQLPFLAVSAGLLVLYLLLFVLFAPYRGPVPPPAPVPANGLRYLVPTVPLIALCGGPLLVPLFRAGRGPRAVSLALAAVLFGTGAVAAVAEVELRQFSTSPLFAPAVDFETVLGRTTRFTYPPVGELKGDQIAVGLKEGDRHRFARRTWLYSLAVSTAGKLDSQTSGDAVRDLVRLLMSLEAGDRDTVLEELVARLDLGLSEPPWAPQDPRFEKLLASADQRTRGLLWRAYYLAAHDPLWGLHLRLSEHKPIPTPFVDPRLSSEQIAGFCWNLGYMSGIANRQAKDPVFELRAALVIADAIPDDFADQFFEGLGRAFGERWGYSSRVGLQLRDGLPAAYQDRFQAAYLQGAERRFLYPLRGL